MLQLTRERGIRINRLHSVLNFGARLQKASRGDVEQRKRTLTPLEISEAGLQDLAKRFHTLFRTTTHSASSDIVGQKSKPRSNMTARASTRISIRWPPAEASEPTDTLVLSVGEYYVDLRVLKEDGGLDWGLAGQRIVVSEDPRTSYFLFSATSASTD